MEVRKGVNNQIMKSLRIRWIDIAKGICIISIVIGHVCHNSFIRTYTLSFDVPMFFFLSGLCYRKPVSSTEYFINKIKRVVVPYFFFSLVSILVFAIAGRIIPQIGNIMNYSLKDNILIMLWGNSKPDVMKYNSPLWFLPCYFSVIIMALIVVKIVDFLCNIRYIREIILICLILMGRGCSIPSITLPWHCETAVSMLVWFELGIIFKEKCLFDCSIKFKNGVIVIFLVVGVLFGFINRDIAKTSLQVRQDVYGVLVLYYLSAFFGIVGFSLLSQRIGRNKILEYCGRNSLSILVVHKFPVLFFQQLFPPTKAALIDSNSIVGIGTGIIVTIISMILSLIVCNVIKRVCPFVLGEKRINMGSL